MNSSHTIKDKQIPRWQPLQRVHHLALAKVSSPKRILLILIAAIGLLLLLQPHYTQNIIPRDNRSESDDETLERILRDFRSLLTLHAEFAPTSGKQTAVFVTAHELGNATGLTMLACEMAAARKLNVLMLYVGRNSTERVPFFLRENQFDRASACPMTWFDARHGYSSLNDQESATEAVLREVVRSLNPPVVVSLDDDADWCMECLERVVYWKQPSISSIQLKRSALPNLHWMTQLGSFSLAGIPLSKFDLSAAWNIPQIDIVITTSQENTGTLYRLIASLINAEYLHPIRPRLFITFNPNTTTPQILNLLQSWPSDRLIIRHQIYPIHTGFPGALQSWFPSDRENYVLVLEDNVELSPWYMYWLHLSLLKYVYSAPTTSTSLLAGISLQSASSKATKERMDVRRVLLMSPMYAGWTSYSTPYMWQESIFHSTLFFPAQWREFHAYVTLREHFARIGGDPTYRSGDELALETYWLELILARGYAILYPNFDDDASFAIRHSTPLSRYDDFAQSPLINWAQYLEEVNRGLPDWEDLPVLDFEKSVVGWDRLDTASRQYRSQLSMCKDFPVGDVWHIKDLFCYPEDDGGRGH
jgi:hypothetical protein